VEGQTATETPLEPALGERSGATRPLGAWREWLRSPFSFAIVACLALAALSAAVVPTVPSYDPWSWIVWGREVFDPHLSFAVGGGPSWKPLPVIFTAVFGLFGGAAPTLWVITARAGGLLAPVAAYRLGARLARDRGVVGGGAAAAPDGDRDGWWAAASGVIAALAVLLTQDWFYYMFRGTSEPMLVGASLWAIERHLAGRHGSAFVLGVAASLIRPEAWPFILAYGAWLWLREPRLRVLVGVGLLAIPFFWFVPPWIGSGQPFLAASHAKAYNGHLGSSRLLTVLRRGADLQTVPVLIAALVAVGLAWFRERDRLTLALAGGALAWWVIVVGMTLDGYPGLERFYLPAAGIACVLAGVGVVRVARLAGAALGGRGAAVAGGRSMAVAAGVAVLLVGVAVALSTARINTARAQERIAARAVTHLDQLSAAVAAVGGHHGVYPCRSSFTAVNHGVQTALAWKLHVTLGRVGTAMRHQGLLFVGPHDTIDGAPAAVSRRLTQIRLIAHVGVWQVYRVTAPGASTRCVGT
jgi:hypothetical protein